MPSSSNFPLCIVHIIFEPRKQLLFLLFFHTCTAAAVNYPFITLGGPGSVRSDPAYLLTLHNNEVVDAALCTKVALQSALLPKRPTAHVLARLSTMLASDMASHQRQVGGAERPPDTLLEEGLVPVPVVASAVAVAICILRAEQAAVAPVFSGARQAHHHPPAYAPGVLQAASSPG